MNTPMPLPGGASGSVRAKTRNMSAAGALVMYRLSPSMTHPPASGAGRGAEPARVRASVRLGQRERRDHLAGRQLGQPLLALLGGARRDQHLAGDPVVGAEQRPERGAGVAELDGHPDLLGHRQAEPAVLRRQRVAVQAHLLGLGDQPGRDLIGLVDAGLGRQHLTPDEPAQQAEQLVEVGLVHHAPSVTSSGPAGKPVRLAGNSQRAHRTMSDTGREPASYRGARLDARRARFRPVLLGT